MHTAHCRCRLRRVHGLPPRRELVERVADVELEDVHAHLVQAAERREHDVRERRRERGRVRRGQHAVHDDVALERVRVVDAVLLHAADREVPDQLLARLDRDEHQQLLPLHVVLGVVEVVVVHAHVGRGREL